MTQDTISQPDPTGPVSERVDRDAAADAHCRSMNRFQYQPGIASDQYRVAERHGFLAGWDARHRLASLITGGLVREVIARIIEPNAFGSEFGLPDATVSKMAAFDKADAILAALATPPEQDRSTSKGEGA